MKRTSALLALWLSLAIPALADTDWEKRVRQLAPDAIEIETVERKGEELIVRGKAASNPDISHYLRSLQKSVGTPSLDYVKREDDLSHFSLRVRIRTGPAGR